jgi:hypothetical protein
MEAQVPSLHTVCTVCGTTAVPKQGTPEAPFTPRRYIAYVQGTRGTPWVGTKPRGCLAVVKFSLL